MMPRSTRPGDHRAAARDREHVLDRHQKRPVHRALRLRNVVVDRGHQLEHRLLAQRLVAALQRVQRRALDHRNVVARKLVLREQLAHLQLDQLQQLRVVHLVDLVQVDHQRRHPDLARQQNVLARLRHRPVGRAHHQDRAVHLRRPGDHVLDVVRVPRAVDVRVVALGGLVLDVRGVDRDAARLLLRRLVDLVVAHVGGAPGLRQNLGDRRGQGRLAVVHVPDRAHVRVRLGPLEFRLRHLSLLSSTSGSRRAQPCIGAGDGNRTHTASLEGWSSTIELHPHHHNRRSTSTEPTSLGGPGRTGTWWRG